jgi:8-oxo-dGTP pyrophosphatase MutT (NUDIX family)
MQRPSARLLVLNATSQVLLFRFEHTTGPLAGQTFWATAGGALDTDESYEDAACRELQEEVGLKIAHPGRQVARRTAVFCSPSGEMIEADERYFIIEAGEFSVSDANRTALERVVMVSHRWWDQAALLSTTEQVWPEDISAILVGAGVWAAVR